MSRAGVLWVEGYRELAQTHAPSQHITQSALLLLKIHIYIGDDDLFLWNASLDPSVRFARPLG